LNQAVEQFSTRYWRWLVIAMLGCLHVAVMLGVNSLWARGLMVAHVGFFILWQPFMRTEQRVRAVDAAVIGIVVAAAVIYLNWWLLGIWLAILAGIVGGKVFLFRARRLRVFYLSMFLYLVSMLLVWVVPNGFPIPDFDQALLLFAHYGLPALFIFMLLLRVESDTAEPQIVDLFYAALIFLLLISLALGSFAFMTIGALNYPLALSYTLVTIGAVLILLSLAWNPRTGVSGLSMLFSRYLLSIGLPFEQWLRFLAALSSSEARPHQFLKDACNDLARLPWVIGGEWSTATDAGNFGIESKHVVLYSGPEFTMRLFSRTRPSPSLVWHFNLLGQLLGQFYVAKQRERKLREQTYVQALHETGARLTHDVKNLLQSLNALCAAVERDNGDPAALNALVRRNLPTVTQRLQQTMDKLQRPQTESTRLVHADAWWEQLQKAHQMRGIEFEAVDVSKMVLLPKELFDSASDNLLQNALEKRRHDPTVTVRVKFECGTRIALSVCDSGRPIPPEVMRGLLKGPVTSETGYGIGLYQVCRQAENAGFSLDVVSNEEGKVCLELHGEIFPREFTPGITQPAVENQ
jgi:signal transduction histidine kinase